MKRSPSSTFYKNVATLMSGTVIAQLLPFIALPFLQRYFYSPAEFAIFFTFTRFADIFMSIANLKLELGMVMQKTALLRKALIALAYRILMVFVIGMSLVMLIFNQKIADMYGAPEMANYLYLIPVVMLFFGLYQLFYYWLNAQSNFKGMAVSKVVQTSTGEGGKLIFGFMGLGPAGLILGRVIGYGMAMLYSLFHYRKSEEVSIKASETDRKNQWQINKDFALFSAPSTLVKALINFLVIDMILKTFGADQAGNFGASMQYMGALLGMLSASFGQVYYNRISEITDKKTLLENYLSWVKKLGLVALSILVIVNIVPNAWVVALLGDKWAMLLPIAKIMVVWMSVQFVSGSLSFIYVRLGKQSMMLFLDILQLVIAIGGLYLGEAIWGDLKSTLWAYTIGQTLFYISALLIAVYFIKTSKIMKT